MFNVAVIRMKDIIKYLIGIIFIMTIIYISRIFYKKTSDSKLERNFNSGARIFTSNSMLKCISDTMPVVSALEEKINAKKEKNENDIFERVLKTEISSLSIVEESKDSSTENEDIENDIVENIEENINNSNEKNVELARNKFAYTKYNKQSHSRKL